MEDNKIKRYIQEKKLEKTYLERDAENLISDLNSLDLTETPVKGIKIIKALSESKEEAAVVFIQKLQEKISEITQEIGI